MTIHTNRQQLQMMIRTNRAAAADDDPYKQAAAADDDPYKQAAATDDPYKQAANADDPYKQAATATDDPYKQAANATIHTNRQRQLLMQQMQLAESFQVQMQNIQSLLQKTAGSRLRTKMEILLVWQLIQQ